VILNIYIGLSVDNISNTAHVGGLLFGYLSASSVYSRKGLRTATPTTIVLGLELVLLAVWILLVA
jgi:rhomboid protease GluP